MAFSLRLRFHYKAVRAAGVICDMKLHKYML